MTAYNDLILDITEDFKYFDKELLSLLESKPNCLVEEIKTYLFSGSKRIRPALIFLMTRALNQDISREVIGLACAAELIHNSTLIHDDIIDNSDKRRNNITLNSRYDSRLAVITGDFLLSLAMEQLLSLKNMNIFEIFTKSLTQICDGEINQYFEKGKIPSIEEYIQKSKQKTAKLFEASISSLAEIFERREYYDNLVNFAQNFGIAFQIRDDLLNIISINNSKPIMDDIGNGIYTAPVVFLSEIQTEINFNDKEKLLHDLKTHNTIDKTRELINLYIKSAIDSIKFIEDNQYKSKIIEICNFIREAKEN